MEHNDGGIRSDAIELAACQGRQAGVRPRQIPEQPRCLFRHIRELDQRTGHGFRDAQPRRERDTEEKQARGADHWWVRRKSWTRSGGASPLMPSLRDEIAPTPFVAGSPLSNAMPAHTLWSL